MPHFNKIGKIINNTSEGKTSQKILYDKEIIFSDSFVSIYNQINAKIEINGIDANKPPRNEFRFDISVIKTIRKAEIITLIM